jgi:3D (Asp-Asp-Asp) domain-containing protein
MRLIIASIVFHLIFVQNLPINFQSNIVTKSKKYQKKSSSLVMIENGKLGELNEESERAQLSGDLHSFKTIEERKIADHNRARLDLYRPRLEKYSPPKDPLSILVTGYSSTPDQTWGDPFTTASGTRVHKGTMACPPQYPFGTKVEITKLGTFICEDRGGAIKGDHFDMWFESRAQALNWGKRIVSAEIKK